MKTEQVFLYAILAYSLLHVALAADAIPPSLRPLAKKLENEELTKAAGVVLTALFA